MNPFTTPDDTFENQTFNRITFDKGQVRGREFHDCHFVHCSLREATLENCRFNDCTFKDCDLSLARLDGSTCRNVDFKTCRLIGANWALIKWPKFLHASPIQFQECALDYASFMGLRLHKISFAGCILREVDFTEADLTEADFRRAVLSRSQFNHTNLTRANFAGATDYLINPTLNTVTQAIFSLPEAISLLHTLNIRLEDS